jgi:hypothetical protein
MLQRTMLMRRSIVLNMTLDMVTVMLIVMQLMELWSLMHVASYSVIATPALPPSHSGTVPWVGRWWVWPAMHWQQCPLGPLWLLPWGSSTRDLSRCVRDEELTVTKSDEALQALRACSTKGESKRLCVHHLDAC